MNDELTPEQQTRIDVMRACGDALHEALMKDLGVDYNIIILVCPKRDDTVTIAARVDTLKEVNGMLSIAKCTETLEKAYSETLQ